MVLGPEAMNEGGLYFYGKMSLLRAGIVSSDLVTTVSPQYAWEIRTQAMGCGMDDVLRDRGEDLLGILNGIDYSHWNPEKNSCIAKSYSAETLALKAKNKKALQSESGLADGRGVPLFGFVGRFSHQKGINLLRDAGDALSQRDIQMVFLGVGDSGSESVMRSLAQRHPGKVAVHFKFDECLAHRILAGSDFFLMPSVFEPCGLTQLMALRYGAMPIVSAVGGLVDTVRDISGREGTGIVLKSYDVPGLLEAVDRAVAVYQNRAGFESALKRGMAQQFSWDASAARYQEAYESLKALP